MPPRSAADLAQHVRAEALRRYGDDPQWADIWAQLPVIIDEAVPSSDRVRSRTGIHDQPAGASEERVRVGNWFYNVSDNWLELVVLALPAVLAASTGVGAVALAALAVVPLLVKNLSRIDRKSLEWRVYEVIAAETARNHRGATLNQIRRKLRGANRDEVVLAVANLRLEDHVIDQRGDRYLPHAF